MAQDDAIEKIMSRTVQVVSPKETVERALAVMVTQDIGSVMVGEGGKLSGILTERDVVKMLGREGAKALQEKVGDVASRPLVTVSPDTQVWEAFTLLLRKKIRRLPVMNGEQLVGIVTERDLFKWVVRVIYEPNIPEDIKSLLIQKP